MPGRNIAAVKIHEFRGDQSTRRKDFVAVEEPLEIRISSEDQDQTHSLAVTMRTPGNDFDLAAGFLFSEGIVGRREQIARMTTCVARKEEQQFNAVKVELKRGVEWKPEKLVRHFFVNSSCGVCGKAAIEQLSKRCAPVSAGPDVSVQVVHQLSGSLRETQTTFQKTGGLHASVLFDKNGKLLSLCEDVGRHNALDKLVGQQFLAGKVPLAGHVLLVSGRTSFEILQKSIAAGIPIVAGIGAPSSLAVDLANELNVTLIGFLRENRFNIYSAPERIQN